MADATLDIVQPKTEWRGPALPVRRGKGGYFASRTLPDLLWSSIVMILLTPLGSRIMKPKFGSLLYELVFELNDDVLRDLAQRYIQDAIRRWEPRITILETDVKVDESTFEFLLTFRIKSDGQVISRGLVFTRFSDLAILRTL